MSNIWLTQAEILKKAIEAEAIRYFLNAHTVEQISEIAGQEFGSLPERERSSIIKTLAASQLQRDTRDLHGLSSADSEALMSNTNVQVNFAS
uniref:hypothetical protein n=1 Tax=Pseudomonas syringae TaxID=317 RepID=UPI001E52083A|nr:hypothetical protein [Pseudomonas syringae]QOQ33558.1 hypothetical protein [Pseudomonas syringae pv. actinidiae]